MEDILSDKKSARMLAIVVTIVVVVIIVIVKTSSGNANTEEEKISDSESASEKAEAKEKEAKRLRDIADIADIADAEVVAEAKKMTKIANTMELENIKKLAEAKVFDDKARIKQIAKDKKAAESRKKIEEQKLKLVCIKWIGKTCKDMDHVDEATAKRIKADRVKALAKQKIDLKIIQDKLAAERKKKKDAVAKANIERDKRIANGELILKCTRWAGTVCKDRDYVDKVAAKKLDIARAKVLANQKAVIKAAADKRAAAAAAKKKANAAKKAARQKRIDRGELVIGCIRRAGRRCLDYGYVEKFEGFENLGKIEAFVGSCVDNCGIIKS